MLYFSRSQVTQAKSNSQLFPLRWFLKNPTTTWTVELMTFWASALEDVEHNEGETDTGMSVVYHSHINKRHMRLDIN